MNSLHYLEERKEREALIQSIGFGKVIKTAIVDRGHKNGPELHQLSDTGIVTIYNARTHKMITKLIARPGQIRKFFKENEIIPQELIKLAIEHKQMGYNCI